jgi:threonine synthase
VIVLSTAHPAKFPEAVAAASGRAPTLPPMVTAMAEKPERFERLPADAAAIKAHVRNFAEA